MFFVYWAYGSCNEGSCARGFDKFETLAAAVAFVEDIFERQSIELPVCTIVEGEIIEERTC